MTESEHNRGHHVPRRKIIREITTLIRSRYPRQVLNDDIASTLELTSEQVRKAVKNYMNTYPRGGITEVAPYVYVAVEGADTAVGRPVTAPTSAVPATTRRVDTVATRPTGGWAFHIVAEASDGSMILQDQDRDIWRATRL